MRFSRNVFHPPKLTVFSELGKNLMRSLNVKQRKNIVRKGFVHYDVWEICNHVLYSYIIKISVKCTKNNFKKYRTIAIFIHYKPRIAVAILDL